MFVVAEDFDRLPFNISGLNDLSTGVFDDFVSYHEEENLRKLFGNLFYDAFVKGLIGKPVLFQEGLTYTSGEIGRASCREECLRLCRSRWSPYH